MNKVGKLLGSFLLPFVAAAIGSFATFPNIATWYAGLLKPFFNPPNWVFGPVWTILYILMGLSLYLAWTARYKGKKSFAFVAFGMQLALNALWSVVFFGLHSLIGGVVIIVALLVMVALTMWLFWPISRRAVYLLVPYIAWICFATLLNIAVAALN